MQNKPGCLSLIVQFLGLEPKTARPEIFPYRVEESVLTAAELDFYRMLRQVVGQQAMICPKVRMLDIIRAHHEYPERYNAKLMSKHLDFLLCEPEAMHPLVGIELDDSSHQRPDRQARDEFVDKAFVAARLPLLHIKFQPQYSLEELRRQLSPYVAGLSSTPDTSATVTSSVFLPTMRIDPKAPLCPVHKIPMVRLRANQGIYAGKHFYGCPNYPGCREKIPID